MSPVYLNTDRGNIFDFKFAHRIHIFSWHLHSYVLFDQNHSRIQIVVHIAFSSKGMRLHKIKNKSTLSVRSVFERRFFQTVSLGNFQSIVLQYNTEHRLNFDLPTTRICWWTMAYIIGRAVDEFNRIGILRGFIWNFINLHYILKESWSFQCAKLDARAVSLPFTSFTSMTSITTCYLGILHFVPKYMANRPAYTLRVPILAYNFVQILLNSYLLINVSYQI